MRSVSNRVVFSSSSVLCFTKRKNGKDLVNYTKNKYGEENVLEEICSKCSKKFKHFSAGICEDESRMMQYYAGDSSTTFEMSFSHLFANWDVFGSGHALLLQSFLFQNAISHMFYSNFSSFTPSIYV